MWNRKELKTNAKAALRNYMARAIVALLLVSLIALPVTLKRNTSRVNSSQDNFTKFIDKLYEDNNVVSFYANDEQVSGVIEEEDNDVKEVYYFQGIVKSIDDMFNAIPNITIIIFLYNYFLVEPVMIGYKKFIILSRKRPTRIREIFSDFNSFGNYGLAMFLLRLKVVLWSLLFVIPGVIKTYEYRMVPYILAENPNMPIRRAFQISADMTDNNKWNLFVLDLSFILWNFLGFIFLPARLYVDPYINATNAEAYCKLKADAVLMGKVSLAELPDVA